MPALTTGALDALDREQVPHGAGAITFVRQLGGAFGVNLLTFFLEWRHRQEGGDFAGEVAAFQQSFWLMGVLFALTILAAWNLRPSQR